MLIEEDETEVGDETGVVDGFPSGGSPVRDGLLGAGNPLVSGV